MVITTVVAVVMTFRMRVVVGARRSVGGCWAQLEGLRESVSILQVTQVHQLLMCSIHPFACCH